MTTQQMLRSLSVLVLLSSTAALQAFPLVQNKADDIEVFFDGKFRPELFYGKNVSLLNDGISADQVFYGRQTLDYGWDIVKGRQEFQTPTTEFNVVFRNRITWGNLFGIGTTTTSQVKIGDVVTGAHDHALLLLFPWLREGWLYVDLNRALDQLDLKNKYTFMVGAFPFELGRGIALGNAYAVAPGFLGFYNDSAIDQYAFGMKLFGELKPNVVSYDLYATISQNKSASLGETNKPIYTQAYGRRDCPQRGFGVVHYIIANRFNWRAFDNDAMGRLDLQPYWLYNDDPEQKIEFLGDASSKLGTLGFAGEYIGPRFEFGFDMARNIGRQKVNGWDRNQTELQTRNGRVEAVNTHVYINEDPLAADAPSNATPFKVVYSPNTITTEGFPTPDNPLVRNATSIGTDTQKTINAAPQEEARNGKAIGFAPGLTAATDTPTPVQADVDVDQLYNAKNRFRDPYTNTFHGWMAVADASYWLHDRQINLAGTIGIASGDDNPNEDTIDGRYDGFISLQELYSGKRVKSAFVLGGSGKLKRSLSTPRSVQSPTEFATLVSGFTNLRFVGGSMLWTPKNWRKKFSFNSNVIAYWQDRPIRAFDLLTKQDLPCCASTALGVEVNCFMNYNLLKDLQAFVVAAIFVPGQHYADIRGKPFNAEEKRALDRFNPTAPAATIQPNISDDLAFTCNVGLEYRF